MKEPLSTHFKPNPVRMVCAESWPSYILIDSLQVPILVLLYWVMAGYILIESPQMSSSSTGFAQATGLWAWSWEEELCNTDGSLVLGQEEHQTHSEDANDLNANDSDWELRLSLLEDLPPIYQPVTVSALITQFLNADFLGI